MAERAGRADSGATRRCVSCGAEARNWRAGRCPACALEVELGCLRADGDPSAVARLEPLLARLASHDKPRSALSWLERSPAAPTFRALLGGEVAISHAALDERDVGQATAYLRSWLVDHGVLGPRDERLARFERWSKVTLAGVPEHPDRPHLTAYARWKLRPDLARRLRTGKANPTSHRWAYAKLRTAIHLTAWLHDRGHELEHLHQPLLDEWIATAPSRALATRDFTGWAHHAGLLPALSVRRPAPQTNATPIDQTTRLRQARALLETDTVELPTRVAGCLLLLYGQPVTRIVTLRRDDVKLQRRSVRLRLGEEPVEVAEPLSALLRKLHERADGPWLLPGAKPGAHISSERTRRRLRQLGIRPGSSRPAALLGLAGSVPAPILGELLGYCDDTANHWRRAAGGDWARYASLRSTPTS